jgi:hypothetical protein
MSHVTSDVISHLMLQDEFLLWAVFGGAGFAGAARSAHARVRPTRSGALPDLRSAQTIDGLRVRLRLAIEGTLAALKTK